MEVQVKRTFETIFCHQKGKNKADRLNTYPNAQARIKHAIDYHPSPLQLFSRVHPLIFLWSPKGLISPESFLSFS